MVKWRAPRVRQIARGWEPLQANNAGGAWLFRPSPSMRQETAAEREKRLDIDDRERDNIANGETDNGE